MSDLRTELSKCECHDCTQARWKASLQGQMDIAFSAPRAAAIEAHGKPPRPIYYVRSVEGTYFKAEPQP